MIQKKVTAMKKIVPRHTALLLIGALLSVMAACAAPQPTPQAASSDDAPTASPVSTSVPATVETSPAFPYREFVDAAQRAEEYFYECMNDSANSHYAVFEFISASALPYEKCMENEEIKALLSFGAEESGKAYLQRLADGEAILVRVHFYVEYQPEANYLGMQYSDGLNAVYILVPVDASSPCEQLSGWHSEQPEGYAPRRIEEADRLGLTTYQHRMLVHQCSAMAAAGLRDFTSPNDWSEEELYAYLYCRAQDFGIQEAAWQSENPSGYANMFLTIDFTPEDDWSMSTRFLPQEWPGFSQEQIRTYGAKLEKRAVPGYDSENPLWQFSRKDDQITAQLMLPDNTISQTYTFALHEGFDSSTVWNGRTYCIAGNAFSVT